VTVGGGGKGVLNCVFDHILQEFYALFLTRFRTYQIDPPNHSLITARDNFLNSPTMPFVLFVVYLGVTIFPMTMKHPESIACTLPPFGPIEGQKWFDQISSQ
jgi:hypothetical protein